MKYHDFSGKNSKKRLFKSFPIQGFLNTGPRMTACVLRTASTQVAVKSQDSTIKQLVLANLD